MDVLLTGSLAMQISSILHVIVVLMVRKMRTLLLLPAQVMLQQGWLSLRLQYVNYVLCRIHYSDFVTVISAVHQLHAGYSTSSIISNNNLAGEANAGTTDEGVLSCHLNSSIPTSVAACSVAYSPSYRIHAIFKPAATLFEHRKGFCRTITCSAVLSERASTCSTTRNVSIAYQCGGKFYSRPTANSSFCSGQPTTE